MSVRGRFPASPVVALGEREARGERVNASWIHNLFDSAVKDRMSDSQQKVFDHVIFDFIS